MKVKFLLFLFIGYTIASIYDYSLMRDFYLHEDYLNPYQAELDFFVKINAEKLRTNANEGSSTRLEIVHNAQATRSAFNLNTAAELGFNFTTLIMSRPENAHRNPLDVIRGLVFPRKQCPFKEKVYCERDSKYSNFDGTCNNLENPLLGATETPYKRYLAPEYSDGIASPRRYGKSGYPLPNPRQISRTIQVDNGVEERIWSHYFVLFGQFLTHDFTLLSTASDENGNPLDCPCDSTRKECLAVPAPLGEKIMKPCMKFTRSSSSFPNVKCNLGYREEVDLLTSYLDLTEVYGTSVDVNNGLRLFRDGLLRMSEGVFHDRKYLPKSPTEVCGHFFINSTNVSEKLKCFLGGEGRTNENMGITSIQVLFVREHNRIAHNLKYQNPHWSDNRLFNEARKILIGVYQHIIYSQYLGSVTGVPPEQLKPLSTGYSHDYDPKINPALANEFGAAAFRWGHSAVRQKFERFNAYNASIPNSSTDLFNIVEIVEEAYDKRLEGLESMLVGMVNTVSSGVDLALVFTLRNQLFEKFTKEGVQVNPPIDLAATNIQRGRDHGVPPYIKFRQLCGLSPVYSFEDLSNEMSQENIKKLKKVYEHVDDIDLWVGGLAESVRLNGSVVGKTFQCIINKQFYDLKVGDRFYYENAPNKYLNTHNTAFTLSQLNEIRKMSMSTLICKNFDVKWIQPNVFFTHDINSVVPPNDIDFNVVLAPNNQRRLCSTYWDMDFSAWKDQSYRYQL